MTAAVAAILIALGLAPAADTSGLAAATQADPASSPTLTLRSPAADSLLVGVSTLEATLSSTVGLVRLEFFVDGVLVCAVTKPPLSCTWDAGSAVRSRTVRAVATFETGPRVTQMVRTSSLEHRVESVDVRSVLVPAVVTDGNGRFVQGLGRGDFQLFANERPVAISHFEAEDAPLSVVLTVDLSNSMRRVLPDVRDAIRRFVSALKASDRVTMLGFNERMYVLAEGPRDAVLQGPGLDRLAAGGTTALYDAIVYAVGHGAGGSGRHAVVVVSDGADMASQAEFDAVERLVQSSDATIYAIAVGAGAKDRRARTIMERLADRSGGRAFHGGGVTELTEALAAVRDDLAHQYLLGFTPDANGGPRRLRVAAGGGRYRVRIRAVHEPAGAIGAAPSVR